MRIFVPAAHEDVRGPIPGIATELVMALGACSCYVETHRWCQRHASESVLTKARDRARQEVGVWRALRVREFDVPVVNASHDWRTLVRDLALVPALRRGGRVVLQLRGSGIASTMLTLLKDPELADRIGRANRLRVRMFAPQVVAREYLEILEGLVPTARAFPR